MFRTVTIKEFERGLEYRKGRFIEVLEPGRYRIWPFTGREITKVDVRENALQITGQEVLTADNVAVRLNVLVRFRVADAARAMHEVASYLDALHQTAQLAVREVVAARTVEDVLAQRMTFTDALTEATNARAGEFGLQVIAVAIKDAMLNSGLKAAYEAKLMADQKGQATLIEARRQVAAARAQANAAKILADNPAILAQRQLDVLEKAAVQGYNNHFVVLPEGLANLARALTNT